MSNAFYNHSSSIAAGATARASQVRGEFDEIAAGFDLVEAEFDRTFRFASGAGAEFAENAANRANKVLGFDNSGVAALSSLGAWKGDWATATAYGYKDMVRAPSANGYNIYICQVAHTSGTFNTDVSNGKFALVADLGIIVNELKTADFTAVAGGDYFVDTSGGNVQITLPASPAITDRPITVTVIGNASTVTLLRNGLKIMSLEENMTVDIANASFRLMYCNATYGWRLSNI